MRDSQPTILVIDNDEGMVAAITTRLESLGYACITGASGAQGISVFHEQPVDLIITDLNMPAGDGVAVCKMIRESSQVPIVVITGFKPEFAREIRDVADVTILEKPFDSNQLVDLVEACLVMSGCQLPV